MTCWELMAIIGVLGIALLVVFWPEDILDNIFPSLLGGIALFVAILVSSIVYGSRAAGANQCRAYSEQTGYETKFVVVGPGATGTCLARIQGRWINKDNVQSFRIDGGGKP